VWSYIYNPQIGRSTVSRPAGVKLWRSFRQWTNDPGPGAAVSGDYGVWQSLGFRQLPVHGRVGNNIPKPNSMRRRGRAFALDDVLEDPLPFCSFRNLFRVVHAVDRLVPRLWGVGHHDAGPAVGATNVVLYYIYQHAFQYSTPFFPALLLDGVCDRFAHSCSCSKAREKVSFINNGYGGRPAPHAYFGRPCGLLFFSAFCAITVPVCVGWC
jgi:hypothetical protein